MEEAAAGAGRALKKVNAPVLTSVQVQRPRRHQEVVAAVAAVVLPVQSRAPNACGPNRVAAAAAAVGVASQVRFPRASLQVFVRASIVVSVGTHTRILVASHGLSGTGSGWLSYMTKINGLCTSIVLRT